MIINKNLLLKIILLIAAVIAVFTILILFKIIFVSKPASVFNTPFPQKLNNSDFTLFSGNPIYQTNSIKIKNFTMPAFHGYRAFYINKNYTIALYQQTFSNSSVAMNYFTEMKRALLLNISANTSITKNTILISNLQPNIFGTNTSIKNLANSYSITGVNGTKICFAGLSQYTKNSILKPVQILETAINTCFKAAQ